RVHPLVARGARDPPGAPPATLDRPTRRLARGRTAMNVKSWRSASRSRPRGLALPSGSPADRPRGKVAPCDDGMSNPRDGTPSHEGEDEDTPYDDDGNPIEMEPPPAPI